MSNVTAPGDNESGLPTVDTLTGNSGGAVGPDSNNNINIVGSGGVEVVGNPSTNTLTITVTSGGFSWTDVSESFDAFAENGYFITGEATGTLPASPSQGDTIIFNTVTTDTVTIQANTGQSIVIGADSSSVGGTATSSVTGNSLSLTYRSTGATWREIGSTTGTWSLSV